MTRTKGKFKGPPENNSSSRNERKVTVEVMISSSRHPEWTPVFIRKRFWAAQLEDLNEEAVWLHLMTLRCKLKALRVYGASDDFHLTVNYS